MTNTANTPKPNDCPTIRRKIGKTTYIVRVHFSETAKAVSYTHLVHKFYGIIYANKANGKFEIMEGMERGKKEKSYTAERL